LQLDDEYSQRLLDLFHEWERNPQALLSWLLLIVFLTKKDGGQRPVGLTMFFFRVWSKCRHDVASAWDSAHNESFFWSLGNKTCESSGWVHGAYVAAGRLNGLASASAFTDLFKYYEMISHQDLYEQAVETGFNLVLLRGLCVYYSGWRAISFEGATSLPFQVFSTVVAGCSCATTLARLCLYTLLKR